MKVSDLFSFPPDHVRCNSYTSSGKWTTETRVINQVFKFVEDENG